MEPNTQSTAYLAADFRQPAPKLTALLELLIKVNGSDLHITTNSQPRMRINGDLQPLTDFPILTAEETKNYAESVMSDKQKAAFADHHELDLSFGIQGLSRFRVNIFDQRNGLGIVFRAIPFEVIPVDKLKLPPQLIELCDKPHGLILVTGPTGSGKSTTLASLLDKINRERPVHILTIEDPIEFIHGHKKGCVNQREIGPNTASFPDALRVALRQDPDIVLIGELRDLETIESALRIAETGHLTFATLHTNTASSTITRIIDVFPANQQPQIRTQLSNVLAGVMCQQLLPKADGNGRVMAVELMLPNPAIKNLIREDKIHQIQNVMSSGQDQHGMQILNQSLANLVAQGTITFEAACLRSNDINELRDKIGNLKATEHVHVPSPSPNNGRRDIFS
jgi:twitching motility protein PilT